MTEAAQATGGTAASELAAETSTETQPLTLPADAPKEFGPREAGRLFAQQLDKLRRQSAEPEAGETDAAAARQQANEDGAPVDAQPSAEDATEDELAPEAEPGSDPEPELPPIEPPRSWLKAERDRFRSLPRDTQEYLSVREQERDREVRRVQNEAANVRKALATELQAAAQAKQHYEQALPPLLKALEAANAGEFSDIKTLDDAEKLARENPARYAQYAARQQRLALIAQEAKAAEERKQAEQSQAWNAYAAKQDEALIERVPGLAKPEARAALLKLAQDYLAHKGIAPEEASALHNATILRDARIQEIILDGARRWDAQNKLRAARKDSPPPPQRPGTSRTRTDALQGQIDALTQQLEQASGQKALKIAAELRVARLKQIDARRR